MLTAHFMHASEPSFHIFPYFLMNALFGPLGNLSHGHTVRGLIFLCFWSELARVMLADPLSRMLHWCASGDNTLTAFYHHQGQSSSFVFLTLLALWRVGLVRAASRRFRRHLTLRGRSPPWGYPQMTPLRSNTMFPASISVTTPAKVSYSLFLQPPLLLASCSAVAISKAVMAAFAAQNRHLMVWNNGITSPRLGRWNNTKVQKTKQYPFLYFFKI